MALNLGMVSTRFAGLDGVSLEAAKWAEVLEAMGHRCYWLAGELDRPLNRSMLVPEAHFESPRNRWINEQVWGQVQRSPQTSAVIHDLRAFLKTYLNQFIDTFCIDILIVQNALSLPMHIPLGLALTEVIAERSLPAILHHHDFFWERERYRNNAAADFLHTAFPPALPSAEHVVINSAAQEQLACRSGVSACLIPNVMDFDRPPEIDRKAQQALLKALNIHSDDTIILQPTRVVQRKGIEHAIDLARRLKRPKCKLVISHAAGDEGMAYAHSLKCLAAQNRVDLHFLEIQPAASNGIPIGLASKYQRLWALYDRSDFITFPSLSEGFGNALLEAIYLHKPMLVNRYETFVRDIEPLGFDLVTMDGSLDDHHVDQVQHLLSRPARRAEMTRHNFRVARRYFSYRQMRSQLTTILERFARTDLTARQHQDVVIPLKPEHNATLSPTGSNLLYACQRH